MLPRQRVLRAVNASKYCTFAASELHPGSAGELTALPRLVAGFGRRGGRGEKGAREKKESGGGEKGKGGTSQGEI